MFTAYGGDWNSGVDRNGWGGCAFARATIASTSAEVWNILRAAAAAAGAAGGGCWAPVTNGASTINEAANRNRIRSSTRRIVMVTRDGSLDNPETSGIATGKSPSR